MLKRIAATLWGNFESWDEVRKFSLLGLIFGLVIGIYWALRPIKDSIFGAIVGVDYQPYAKIFSLIVVVPIVIIYSKLADHFPRQRLFYIFTISYGLMALIFAWFFAHPVYGLENTIEDPTRIIGWLWYVYVESFGSLLPALFWAFSSDITTEESAKRGFPLIALFGQTGNILGPLLLNAKRWGFSHSGPIAVIIAVMAFATAAVMWIFMKVTPKRMLEGYESESREAAQKEKEAEPGFFEGLKLLITQPYLLGLFLIITIYETIVTVFDFHFKAMAKTAYPAEIDNAAFLTQYAVMTGVVATFCVLSGINNIQRHLGMRTSLVMMPVLVAIAVVALKFNASSLVMAFWIMVIAKAVNYALNQPTLKQLYIPTTKEVKYKSQAWIEMFGGRGSKAAGSGINMLRQFFKTKYGAAAGISMFLTVSSGISLSLIAVWLFVVVYVSKTYDKAIKEKRVVC